MCECWMFCQEFTSGECSMLEVHGILEKRDREARRGFWSIMREDGYMQRNKSAKLFLSSFMYESTRDVISQFSGTQVSVKPRAPISVPWSAGDFRSRVLKQFVFLGSPVHLWWTALVALIAFSWLLARSEDTIISGNIARTDQIKFYIHVHVCETILQISHRMWNVCEILTVSEIHFSNTYVKQSKILILFWSEYG